MITEDFSEYVPQLEGYMNFMNTEETVKIWDLENMVALCVQDVPIKKTKRIVKKLFWVINYLLLVQNRKVAIQDIGRIEMVKPRSMNRSPNNWIPVLKHHNCYYKKAGQFQQKYKGKVELAKPFPVDEYYAKSRKAMRERGETPPPYVRDWEGIEQSVLRQLEWIRKMKAEQGLDTPK